MNVIYISKSIINFEFWRSHMAKTCELCGKHPQAGRSVSHAHNINNRIFYPNLRTIKRTVNGTPTKVKVCMRCLKTVTKNG